MGADHSVQGTDAASKSQSDKIVLDYLVAIIGFGFCRAWIVFCLATPLLQASSLTFSWTLLVSGAATALFIAFVIKRFKEHTSQIRKQMFWVAGLSSLLAAFLIPFSISLGLEWVLFIGFIVGGIGVGILQILWGERFAAHEIRFAMVASPAAAIVTALFVALSSVEMNLIGYVAFPALSYALLILMSDRTGLKTRGLFTESSAKVLTDEECASDAGAAVEPSSARDATPHRDATSQGEPEEPSRPFSMEIGKLMFSIMVFSFLCRVFDAIPLSGEDPFSFFGGSILFSLVIVGIVFLLLVAVLKDRFNPAFTYRLSLPIMVAGFVAIALFFDTHAAFSVLLINVGYEFFDILTWILFTEISRKKGEQPLRIFGLGVAFMFIGMAVGTLGGDILNTLIVNGEVQITVIAMLSILSLVIVAFLVIPEATVEHLAHAVRPDKKREMRAPEQEMDTHRGRLECQCASVSKEYRLTPRESEVLVLLAYGRTLSIIARDLQIAKGTARTHIENIYRKLDVHKQQELIDLVESYEPR